MEELPFGAYIRQLRVAHEMPLRKLAALLDIDTSTLSKIERQERHAKSFMVPIIAETFNLEYKDLQIRFWTDKLLEELDGEDFIIEAMSNVINVLKYGIDK